MWRTTGVCGPALPSPRNPETPIRDVRLARCTLEQVEKPKLVEHVEGLTLSAVTINGKPA